MGPHVREGSCQCPQVLYLINYTRPQLSIHPYRQEAKWLLAVTKDGRAACSSRTALLWTCDMRPGHTALSLVVSQHICGHIRLQASHMPLTCPPGHTETAARLLDIATQTLFHSEQRGQTISLMRSCWHAGGFCTSPSALRLYPSSTTLKVRLPKHGRPADTPTLPGILMV